MLGAQIYLDFVQRIKCANQHADAHAVRINSMSCFNTKSINLPQYFYFSKPLKLYPLSQAVPSPKIVMSKK